MVQEELQQRQVFRPKVSPQEEVATELAVKVLHQRAGSDRASSQLGYRRLNLVEPTVKLLL
jgi:hypothetical protein